MLWLLQTKVTCRVNLNDSLGFQTQCIDRYTIYKDKWYMTRYIHSPSLKACLIAHVQECITAARTNIDRNILLNVTELYYVEMCVAGLKAHTLNTCTIYQELGECRFLFMYHLLHISCACKWNPMNNFG